MELSFELNFETLDEAVEGINKLKETYTDDKLLIKVSVSNYRYLG